jgi:ABC-2 type transport system permease protein
VTKVWTIIRHEIFVTVRRRGYLFTTFGVPLLAAVAVVGFLVLKGGGDEETPQNPLANLPDSPIGYVDHSGIISQPEDFAAFFIAYPDEESATEALEKGQISSFFVIAPNYMQTGDVVRRARQLGVTESDVDLFRAFLIFQLLGGENPNLLARVYEPARVVEHQLDAAGAELSQIDEEERYGSNFVLVYGFAMILLMSTFIPSGYLLRSVIEEKENRTIEVVLSSLRPIQLLAGKVLGQGAMALFQTLVWLAAGWWLFNLAAGEITALSQVKLTLDQIGILLLYFLGAFLLVASFQTGLGAISTNMREGPQYAAFFTLPMVVPLWLLTIFIEAPNGSLAVILSLIPFTAPLAMVQRIAIAVVPVWQLALSLLLLGFSVLVTLWLASKVFRVNLLLAGSLPKPRELLRLLRGS